MFSFLKSKNKSIITDLSAIGVDMHSHLIPGIDDGAETIEDSLALIDRFIELGFRKIITTPHIMSDYFKNTPEIIQAGLADLKKAIADKGIDFEVEAAAEYYLDENLTGLIENKKILFFGKEKYLLFELSYINAPSNLKEAVFKMITSGYTPVIAHPERYPYYYNDFEKYEELKDSGCILQLNTISLAGYYGKGAKKTAEKLLDANLIEMLGSDMHHQRHAAALRQALSEKSLLKIIASGNLLNNSL